MKLKGISGESTDAGHGEWTDLQGTSPEISKAGAEGGGGSEGPSSSPPADPAGGSGSPPVNLQTIVLSGLMLLALAGTAYLANKARKPAGPEAEEIVFEPEVVPLDEGSAVLNALYSTEGYDYIESSGDDEIDLRIVPNKDRENFYDVDGKKTSIQNVRMFGSDRGVLCPIDVQHAVEYIVSGTLRSDTCLFFTTVTLSKGASQLIAYGCSVDLGLDFNELWIAPSTEEMLFQTVREQKKSNTFTFYLDKVQLPKGVNCPSFAQ